MWHLEKAVDIPLSSGKAVNCMASAPDGRVAVGYDVDGADLFDVKGPRMNGLKGESVRGIAAFADGRYLVRNADNNVSVYSSDWACLDVEFDKLGWNLSEGGVAVDKDNQIYVVCKAVEVIRVYRQKGGAPHKQILCRGLAISDVAVVDRLKTKQLLVTSHESSVKILEEECGEGEVRYEVSREGFRAYPTILADNTVLIAWVRDNILSVELYTDRLESVRTVLINFKLQDKEPYRLREFLTNSGEIALCTQDRLYIFRRVTGGLDLL